MINSLKNSALSGIQNGFSKLQENASQIASADTMSGDDSRSQLQAVVDLKANVLQVNASIKVLKVSDEMIGAILDIKA